MPFQIIRNDITKVKADAIVNTANPLPQIGGGTDRAIYKAAGEKELLEERKKIGEILPGHAEATKAFKLKAKHIIHTVGPVWTDGEQGEFDTLRACYDNSLKLAQSLSCESIAFPLISTGTYGFPKDKALQIAVSVFSEFLAKQDMQITLVVFDRQSFVLSGKIFAGMESFIDEKCVSDQIKEEYEDVSSYENDTRRGIHLFHRRMESDGAVFAAKAESLQERVEHVADTWQESLLHWIDRKGYKDSEVYKRANVDRKLFSKIRSNKTYQPKKITAVAFALALQLDLDETKDMLGRAGYALSPSSIFDLIIEYFIEQAVYDTYTINLALFEHDQPLLGA